MNNVGSYKLFLDDIRVPADVFNYIKNPIYLEKSWNIVRNYDEFINVIEKLGLPNLVSFDHDLADEHYNEVMYVSTDAYNQLYPTFEEKTGYDCAKWLCNHCIENKKEFPDYLVHSMNIVGSLNITSYIENIKKYMEAFSKKNDTYYRNNNNKI